MVPLLCPLHLSLQAWGLWESQQTLAAFLIRKSSCHESCCIGLHVEIVLGNRKKKIVESVGQNSRSRIQLRLKGALKKITKNTTTFN